MCVGVCVRVWVCVCVCGIRGPLLAGPAFACERYRDVKMLTRRYLAINKQSAEWKGICVLYFPITARHSIFKRIWKIEQTPEYVNFSIGISLLLSVSKRNNTVMDDATLCSPRKVGESVHLCSSSANSAMPIIFVVNYVINLSRNMTVKMCTIVVKFAANISTQSVWISCASSSWSLYMQTRNMAPWDVQANMNVTFEVYFMAFFVLF